MDTAASLAHALRKVHMHTHSYLPIAAAYCRMLNLQEVVDGMVETRMELSPGMVVQAMVLDVLHGRSPLYRIEQFIEQQHRELLLGQEIDPHLFNDSTITRSLDALFAAGPSKIITQLGIRAVQVFELDMHALSYDTTSTSVWGEYRGSEEKSSLNAMLTRISCLLARHGLGPGACKEQAGCFVILTNVPLESLDAASVLRTYKGQYGIESDFSFLKDPLVVNDLFLKIPSRIDALGMILIIALMIWRLMERQMRLYLKEHGGSVPGWDNRPTSKPTSFMMSTVFGGIVAAELAGVCTLVNELTPRQIAFLSALGLDERVFYDKQVRCVLTRRHA